MENNPMNQDLFVGQWKLMRGERKSRMAAGALIATLMTGGALVGVGCERQGPAERAGQEIDRVVEEAKDKLTPAGPAEKAGQKADHAVEDLTK
jgi:hypothetical protein